MTRSRKRHLKRREEEKEARRQHDVLQDLRLRQHRRERMELVIRDQIKKDKGPPRRRSNGGGLILDPWPYTPTVAGDKVVASGQEEDQGSAR
ncbi:hypothetical protein IWQ60_011116 [Tieghemiomyces parasiticus]|uniref:Uncharacterized protein n=1 Tax=Tieghemiomyces parasiticus TaxID=78921 RepID=A0A9W8DM10_9FUNG|nr:hypothetical protein IWQ60_011116 [Tieghemiomyces parasiticus]